MLTYSTSSSGKGTKSHENSELCWSVFVHYPGRPAWGFKGLFNVAWGCFNLTIFTPKFGQSTHCRVSIIADWSFDSCRHMTWECRCRLYSVLLKTKTKCETGICVHGKKCGKGGDASHIPLCQTIGKCPAQTSGVMFFHCRFTVSLRQLSLDTSSG